MKLLQTLMIAAGVVSLGGAAFAADVPRPPPIVKPVIVVPQAYNWNGVYLGINGGWGWGRNAADTDGFTGGPISLSGGFAGGQIGVNFSAGNVLLGLEADVQWSGIKGSIPFFGGSISHKVNWFGTARARIGLPMDRVLPYITGGFAFSNETRTSPFGASQSLGDTGWVGGGGLEFAVSDRLTAKIEYQYIRMGGSTYTALPAAPTANSRFSTVRVGLNWHL